MVPTYPPLEAYRRDVARLTPANSFGAEDGEWLAASLVLQRYVEAPPDERDRLGADLATHLAVGDEVTVCDAGLRVAFAIEKAGALHLAASWLALLERLLPSARVLELGRVLTQRARLLRKFGADDASRALYDEIERLGQVHAEPELTARAWLGFGIISHMRGNYPDAKRWYAAAALVADDNGCIEPAYSAHIGLLSCAAASGDFDLGLREGWRAFTLAEADPEREAEVLTNLAQLLLDAGSYHAALRGFAAAVARTKYPDVLFPALGGVAMSGARLGSASLVATATAHLERAAGTAWSFPLASALLELSDANLVVGRGAEARRLRMRAAEIAGARGFHELSHRIEHPSVAPAHDPSEIVLSPEAHRIAQDIERFDAPSDLIAIG